MIYYGKQHIDKNDIEGVVDVLKSNFLTQGPTIESFEKKVANYCGAKYAVAVTNATSALHIACLSAGLGEGDVLWTVPNSFTASANCARFCNAEVDFVDIDEKTYNLSVDELERKIKQTKKIPKIVIPVHFAGQSCEMEKIHLLSRQYGFKIIEDASHAIGGQYMNANIGNCQYSDMTVFSFHPVKIITTGEGGMVLTNDQSLYEKLKLYRAHFITRDESLMENEPDGPWYYEQLGLGFNYRMTDIQAALGISQMDKLQSFVKKRREIAHKYDELFANSSVVKTPFQHQDTNSSWHLYSICIDFEKYNLDKIDVYNKMKEKGIVLNVHYIPIHLQPYYRRLGFKAGDFPNSERYYKEAFSLPIYYDLSIEEQKFIVQTLLEILP